MSRRPANHLVVFAKAPRLGTVKSRLARDIGPVEATMFYRRATASLLRRIGSDPRWTCWLSVTPDTDSGGRFWPYRLRRLKQGGGDLGARMQRPLDRLPPGKVVIVGTDVPGIRRAHIAAAFRSLGRCDAVFGPARDGGYWLVGLRRRPRVFDLFRNVRWSSENALKDTVDNLPAGVRIGLLETLDDVDDGAAWARVARTVR